MLAYNTIVVGTDFSQHAARGLRAGIAMANRFGARRVHLVHVMPAAPVVPLIDPRRKAAFEEAHRAAEERLDNLDLPVTKCWVSREVRSGSPARELSVAATSLRADLIVVSRRGHGGLARLVLGSVASTLIRVSHCPVLVVGDDDPPERFERILAAVDLSPISRSVVSNGVSVANASRAELCVLSLFEHPIVTQSPEHLFPHYLSKDEVESLGSAHRDELLTLIEALPKAGLEVEVLVEGRGAPPVRIIENAKERGADLIVMGTSGHNAWHRMILGSTTNHVLVKAPCPVLVVPHLERASVGESTSDLLLPEPGS